MSVLLGKWLGLRSLDFLNLFFTKVYRLRSLLIILKILVHAVVGGNGGKRVLALGHLLILELLELLLKLHLGQLELQTKHLNLNQIIFLV